MRLLNFKANHRKVLIADHGGSHVGLVASANPHDGSSAHGNVAVKFIGPAVQDLLTTELAVLAFSNPEEKPKITLNAPVQDSPVTLQVVTEKKIRDAVIDSIERAGEGDRIDLAMFYLSSRKVIRALRDAHERGVGIRILLDPNKDAFGRQKNGIPNRSVARELHRAGIPVRWCDTHGEQCHAKMMHTHHDDGLETDVAIRGGAEAGIFQEAGRYFEAVWGNNPRHFSVGYPAYEDNSLLRRFLYRFMEATGMSSF
jgi:phosphatidylserine/phosphatidylglycerophosphate/cardiolipin synthase-like enzyme